MAPAHGTAPSDFGPYRCPKRRSCRKPTAPDAMTPGWDVGAPPGAHQAVKARWRGSETPLSRLAALLHEPTRLGALYRSTTPSALHENPRRPAGSMNRRRPLGSMDRRGPAGFMNRRGPAGCRSGASREFGGRIIDANERPHPRPRRPTSAARPQPQCPPEQQPPAAIGCASPAQRASSLRVGWRPATASSPSTRASGSAS